VTSRLKASLSLSLAQKRTLDKRVAESNSFADLLASESLANHIRDLKQQEAVIDQHYSKELIELRLIAPIFETGSIPLRILSTISDDFRRLVGHAAVRLIKGGLESKRVSSELYSDLDLRLNSISQGSSRLLITSQANRDLFDEGIPKKVFERLFRVLNSEGRGAEFLESITDLGPSSSKHLRHLLHLILSLSSEIEMTWHFAGKQVKFWNGTNVLLGSVSHALDVTEIIAKSGAVLEGHIELLSKRERIQLRLENGNVANILFPNAMLAKVTELHLDQRVALRCAITETSNPFTGENSVFYELLSISI
jgi:hypothetical protein